MYPNPPTNRPARARGLAASVMLLLCFALTGTGLPVAQAAPDDPPTPTPAASSPGPGVPTPGTGQGRARASTPAFSPVHGRRNVATLVRSLSPSEGAFVSGRRLRVKIRLARGARLDAARLDSRSITKHLTRSGRTWSGRVPDVDPGVAHLRVSASKSGRRGLRSVRFVVRGQQVDLLADLPAGSGVLGSDPQPGVQSVAVASRPAATFVARVNGHRVDESVVGRAGAGGARSFVVSRADGLHHGRNVVTSTAFLDDGTYESIRRVVAVPRTSPLAEAGRGGRFEQGRVVRLDGSASRPSRTNGRLSYRWRLLRSPDGAPAIGSATSRRASLRLAEPGRYTVALTVLEQRGSTSRSSTDVVELTSTAVRPALGARIVTLRDNDDHLPPARPGASTDGIGMVFDGKFRSFASDFTVNGVVAKAGMYRIDPQTLGVAVVPVVGDGLDVEPALAQAARGDILVLEVLAPGGVSGGQVTAASYSHVVTYDGKGSINFWRDGTTNDGLRLQTTGTGPDPVGSLSGYLRATVDSTHATSGFRFVRDSDHVAYSTRVARVASTSPSSGAVYRLVSSTLGSAISAEPGSGAARLGAKGLDLGQQWQLQAAYAGFYTLADQATGRCLTLTGGDVAVAGCDARGDRTSQLWFPRYDATRSAYRLVAASTPPGRETGPDGALALTADAAGRLTLAPTDRPDQLWTLDVPPGVYTVRVGSPSNPDAGQVLAEPDYGSDPRRQLTVAAETGELTQRWRVVDQPSAVGARQRFSLVNLGSGQCADVVGTAAEDDVAVDRVPCKGSDDHARDQQWEPVATPAGLELHVAAPVGSTAEQGALAVGPERTVVRQDIDSQARIKQVWALERSVDPGADDLAVMTVPDGSGRLLQRPAAGGTKVVAAKSGAPSGPSTWRLTATADGRPQLRDASGTTCLSTDRLFGTVSMGGCDDRAAFVGTQRDGAWTFENREGALVVGPSGDLGLVAPGHGSAFVAVGQNSTLRVGGQQFRATAAIGQGGFWMLAFDQTLRPLPGYPRTFVTKGLDADSGARLATALGELAGTPHVTVLVQSFGMPTPRTDAWNDIAGGLDKLGIDGRRVLQLDGHGNVAAAGCIGCGPGPLDDDSALDGNVLFGGARLEGELGWTSTSTRRPLNGATLPLDQGLTVLAERERTGWPFDDAGSADGQAVVAVYEALGSWPDACHTRADALRDTYCGGRASDWSGRVSALEGLTYAAATRAGSGFAQEDFDRVKSTLLREFRDVQQVHSLTEDLQSLLLTRFVDQSAAFGPDSLAERIKDTIYAPTGPTPRTNNNPQNVGGMLDAIGAGMLELKDIAAVLPLLAAPRRGVGEEAGGAYDILADGFLFAATVVELTGSDDGGEDSLDVDAPLEDYSGELTSKLAKALDNIDGVRDLVLTDPAALSAAATNRSYGPWQLTTDQKSVISTTFSTGLVRDLWPRELGAGFQLWRWPRLPSGSAVDDIAADVSAPDSDAFVQALVYDGQPDNAYDLPIVKIDASGAPVSRATYVLTRTVRGDNLALRRDRVVHRPITDQLYRQTGLTPDDLPASEPLGADTCAVTWPFPKSLNSDASFVLVKGRVTHFPPKDWSTECRGG